MIGFLRVLTTVTLLSKNGLLFQSSHYGKGTGTPALNYVHCTGQESSLLQCKTLGGWKQAGSACDDHTKDASVYCYGQGGRSGVKTALCYSEKYQYMQLWQFKFQQL